MKKILSLQIVLSVLFVFATNTYSADYDYGVFSACVNGCRGNNAAYSKLSKTEKENADRLIKTCVQACVDTVKENKDSLEKTYPTQKEADQLEKNEQNTSIKKKTRFVVDLGIGMAYPVKNAYSYEYFEEWDAYDERKQNMEFGGLGTSSYIGLGVEHGKTYGGIEFFASRLSSFSKKGSNNYAISFGNNIAYQTYTKNYAFYLTGKYILEKKFNSYFKLGLGYGRTTLYTDYVASYNGEYNKQRVAPYSIGVDGFSYYVAIGGNFYRADKTENNIGCEVRMSSSKYYDKPKSTEIGTNNVHNIKSHNYVLLSTIFFVRF